MRLVTISNIVKGFKMDGVNLTELISNLGFPIVCCIAMFWFIKTTLTRQIEMMGDLRNSMEKNTDTLNALISQMMRDK